MALVKRLYLDWYDIFNTAWTLEIWQEGYVGSASTVALGADPVLIRWNGNDYSLICGSEIIVTIVSNTDLTWLNISNGRDIKVIVKKAGNTYHEGYALPDMYREKMAPGYRAFELTVSDQLGLLIDEEFADGSGYPYDGMEDEIIILAKALSKTGLSLPIRCCVNLFEDSMNSTDADDPLKQCDVDQFTFANADYSPGNCYDTIYRILTQWNARLFQSSGYWWVVPYSDAGSASIDYRDFDTSGAYVSDNSFTAEIATNKTTFAILTSGIIETNPAIKEITVTENYHKKVSILKGSDFPTYEFIDNITLHHWTISVGSSATRKIVNGKSGILIDDNGGSAIDTAKYIQSDSTPVYSGVATNLRIIGGFYNSIAYTYIRITHTAGATVKYWNGTSWVSGATLVLNAQIPAIPSYADALEYVIPLSAFPSDGNIQVTIYDPSAMFLPQFLYLQAIYLEENGASDYPESDNTTTVVSTNNNYRVTFEQHCTDRAAIIGTPDIYGSMVVINTDGSIPSVDGWYKKGTPATKKSLKAWLVNDASINENSTYLWRGTIRGQADYFNTVKITQLSSKKFIWGDIEYNVKRALWSGSAYEIAGVMMPSSPISVRGQSTVTRIAGVWAAAADDVRTGTQLLSSGANTVTFTSNHPGGTSYTLFVTVINSTGENIGFVLSSKTAAGFDINVDEAATVEYIATTIK